MSQNFSEVGEHHNANHNVRKIKSGTKSAVSAVPIRNSVRIRALYMADFGAGQFFEVRSPLEKFLQNI